MTSKADMPDADPDDRPRRWLKAGLMADRLSFRVRGVMALLGARVTEAFAPYGLRAGSFTSMALIAANPGSSQIELARLGGLDKSSIVLIIDDLVKRGYAVRAKSTEDRRRSSLFLTRAGEAVMSEMYTAAMATEASIRDGLGTEDMERLFTLLDRVYHILDSESPPVD
jgi:DNA-binding MarR family transcriptional regulator